MSCGNTEEVIHPDGRPRLASLTASTVSAERGVVVKYRFWGLGRAQALRASPRKLVASRGCLPSAGTTEVKQDPTERRAGRAKAHVYERRMSM